jgi:ribonucleoside-diphosphate reductase beta chain
MIFEEQISRKPDNYPWTKDFIDAMHNGHWTVNDFDFTSDVQDFKVNLTDQEREIVVRTLSAIGQIEVAVKTFWGKLGDNLPHPSIRDLGYVMSNIEVIHNDAYERLLEILGLEEVFQKNLDLEWMSGRVNYLRKYTHRYYKDSKKQFIYALVLFTLFVENVSLFSQFYVINWFKRKNLLKDTIQQTHYTALEEDIHAKAGVMLIKTIQQEYPHLFDEELKQRIVSEASEAFKAESKIIDWMINGIDDKHLSAPLLKEFIKNRINESLESIGYEAIFDIDQTLLENTLWYDELVIGTGMTDFFDQKPVEYSKSDKSYDDLF